MLYSFLPFGVQMKAILRSPTFYILAPFFPHIHLFFLPSSRYARFTPSSLTYTSLPLSRSLYIISRSSPHAALHPYHLLCSSPLFAIHPLPLARYSLRYPIRWLVTSHPLSTVYTTSPSSILFYITVLLILLSSTLHIFLL